MNSRVTRRRQMMVGAIVAFFVAVYALSGQPLGDDLSLLRASRADRRYERR